MTESIDLEAAPSQVFAVVEDLGTYPGWLSIVTAAEPVEGELPAWSVELRGRIGPLARSKRLRMVRTVHDADRVVRFERQELDGREHSPWVLDAAVDPSGTGSRVTMALHYGGGFATGFIERILHDEIDRSRTRLADAVGS